MDTDARVIGQDTDVRVSLSLQQEGPTGQSATYTQSTKMLPLFRTSKSKSVRPRKRRVFLPIIAISGGEVILE